MQTGIRFIAQHYDAATGKTLSESIITAILGQSYDRAKQRLLGSTPIEHIITHKY